MNFHKYVGLVLILGGVCFGDSLIGKDAPELTISQWVTPSPPEITTLSGKVRVLEFWATWCHPCVENIPHLIALNEKYSAKGLEFIALSQDKSADQVREFVKQKKMNYHVAIDNGTTDWYGIKGYPTAVVINHLGKVTWQGYPWDNKFERAISKALAAAPAKRLR